MGEFQDAFISYGRADSYSFAVKLNERLLAEGLKVWFDFEDIPVGVDFQAEINLGIEQSHNFLFIISPHAVHSDYCWQEIEAAVRLNKRIIPIMHVEQISRDVWQSRHPDGTDTDWATYCANGFHSSLAHMHPAIRKINWVMFRDGVDDFDGSLQKLLLLFDRQRDYVHQHTLFLNQALQWERNQRRSPLLLSDEACQQAAAWLNTRFQNTQPPCIPTDLHCDFITTSLKHLSRGMTQVFLSFSEENEAFRQVLQRQLLREGITLWTSSTDINTGEDFQDAINRGIERTDTIVFLMSRASLDSAYCQQELRYAQLYHKRIIPLLLESLDPGQIPVELQTLHFVDFSHYVAEMATPGDAEAPDRNPPLQEPPDITALIKVLRDGADYYRLHKAILVKALEWDRHDRRKDLLLRGEEFVEAESWLETAQQTGQYPSPTRLHRAFIEASKEMNRFFDVFISYGRQDSLDFAIELEEHLASQGFNVWFDKTDIPFGVDFQNQIDDGIEKAHNFLFIISPHAVNSLYCHKEIEYALKQNKRIIPLLHVETISQSLWSQRNPNASEADWAEYQARGLHSVYPNMHPAISKINWIFFRDGIDDVDASLLGLSALIHRHENYVRQHTLLLIQALNWERHQRKTEFLLNDDDRIEAEQWLKTAFQDEQPPCIPTDLQCEFVCESIKNANNLMTQVFICHAEVDHDVREQVRRSLMREGITVWINRTDIKTGTEFQEEINRGIEEADNLVWLMSPASLESEYCRQELEYALYLNKRVIPLLIRPMDMQDVPLGLRSLQFIDVQEYNQPEAYQTALSKLLKVLAEDAVYHAQHKLLLVKALKWKQQKRNPSILLRGYELRHFSNWFQVSKQQTQFRPIPLQEEFLDESEKQPPDKTLNVFISYSRTDADFVRKLNQNLQIQGMTTWFDQENIESGADFKQEVLKGIENSENFLFVISPSSVTSPFCREEVDYAVSLNKRIVTVLYREVSSALLAPALAQIQWIDFRKHGGDFLTNFGELIRTLASDPDHVQGHTRLLVRSREWEEAGRDDSFLLRGKDLQKAATWLEQTRSLEPRPTPLQVEYIKASQALPYRRTRLRWVGVTSVAATLAVAIARIAGLTQGAELATYDQLLRLRPAEQERDERVTFVTVDPASSAELREQIIAGVYEPGIGTLPDAALIDLLNQLQQHQPRLIGIDFIRDFEAEPELAEVLQSADNIIGVCKLTSTATDGAGNVFDDEGNRLTELETPSGGNKPPPELPIEQVGFLDFSDDGGKLVRRHNLMQGISDDDPCATQESFSLNLARRFLEADGYGFESPFEDDGFIHPSSMRLGDKIIPQLIGMGGGYQDMNRQLDGYQSLINFRVHPDGVEHFANTLSLSEVLNGTFDPELVRDRIILIGYSDRADRNADYWDTPYGLMPGVVVQGHMVSQLVSTVLDDRPLIWWWPRGIETLWILGWAATGGLIAWVLYRPERLITAGVGAVLLLWGSCYIVMSAQSGWIPLVPPAIALISTGAVISYLNHRVRTPN